MRLIKVPLSARIVSWLGFAFLLWADWRILVGYILITTSKEYVKIMQNKELLS